MKKLSILMTVLFCTHCACSQTAEDNAHTALIKFRLGHYDAARRDAERSIAASGPVLAHYVLGLCNYATGQFEASIQNFSRDVEAASEPFKPGVGAYIAGSMLYDLHEYSRALSVAETAVVRNPENPSFLLLRGMIRNKLGDASGAQADFQRVVDLDDERSAHAFALCYLHRSDDALEEMETVVKKSPHPETAHIDMALLQAMLGRTDEAMKSLEEGLKRGFSMIGAMERNSEWRPLMQRPEYAGLIEKYRRSRPPCYNKLNFSNMKWRGYSGFEKIGLDPQGYSSVKAIHLTHSWEEGRGVPNWAKDFFWNDGILYAYVKSGHGDEEFRMTFDFTDADTDVSYGSRSIWWIGRIGERLPMYLLEEVSYSYPGNPPIYFSIDPPLYFWMGQSSSPATTHYQMIHLESFNDLLTMLNAEYRAKVIGFILKNKTKLDVETCLQAPLFKAAVDSMELEKLRPQALKYYASAISEELRRSPLFAPKDEFESGSEYEQRQMKAAACKADVDRRYTLQYKAAMEQREAERREKIRASYAHITLHPMRLGTYDVERQVFPIDFQELTGQRLPIPKEEAKSFKENFKKALASADKQLDGEAKAYRFFNIEVTHPVTGSRYVFAKAEPLYTSEAPLVADNAGVPKLEASVVFREPSGNSLLDGNEEAKFELTMKNSGSAAARGIGVNVQSSNGEGVRFDRSKSLTGLAPGQTQTLIFMIAADRSIRDGEARFTFDFTEARGFKPAPINCTIHMQAFKAPHLVMKECGIAEVTGNGNRIIENGENIEVTVLIQNTGQGPADDVRAAVVNGDRNIVALTPEKMQQKMNRLAPGESRIMKFNISVNYEYKGGDELPLSLVLSETFKQYGGSYPLHLMMKQASLAASEIEVKGTYAKDQPIAEASLASAVDIEENIPRTSKKHPNAVALIIGLRDYANADIPKVEYAKRDAQLMRQYLVDVLGYDPRNILPRNPDELMTAGTMKNLVRQRLPSFLKPDGSSDVFIYYSGHGAPGASTHKPFFVPYDCDPNFISADNAYAMEDFYADVAKLNARQKTVVIDACFSGQAGNGASLIRNASPLQMTVAQPLAADAVVFQSSQSDQVSNWYPDKKHGMFTYFFLKGLRGEADADRNGTISVGEMEAYINNENANLPYISRRELQRPQRAVVQGKRDALVRERD
ncbi:MAG: caspase family protein [Acidobacteriota bacterium]